MQAVVKPLVTSKKSVEIRIGKTDIRRANQKIEKALALSEHRQYTGRTYAALFRAK